MSSYYKSQLESQRDVENDEKIIYNNQNYKDSSSNQGSSYPSYSMKHSNSSQIVPNSSNLGNYQSGVKFKKLEGSTNDLKIMTNIDSKFSKIKNMSNSGSASSLLRQYKVSGISSFSSGGNQVSNFSSIMNNQNNKSLVGSSVNSNNSTSTSNQNNYNISSNNNLSIQKNSSNMRKSGSASYLGK